jgi:hypothetical protein
VDHALVVEWHDRGPYELRIEGQFTWSTIGQAVQVLDPETDLTQIERAVRLDGRALQRLTAQRDGRLDLGLADGSSVIVLLDDRFEAWSLVGPHGLRIVCLPGGELAIWKPLDRSGD